MNRKYTLHTACQGGYMRSIAKHLFRFGKIEAGILVLFLTLHLSILPYLCADLPFSDYYYQRKDDFKEIMKTDNFPHQLQEILPKEESLSLIHI